MRGPSWARHARSTVPRPLVRSAGPEDEGGSGALALLLGLCLAATVAHAQEKVIRVGYQKYGTLVLLKGKGLL